MVNPNSSAISFHVGHFFVYLYRYKLTRTLREKEKKIYPYRCMTRAEMEKKDKKERVKKMAR